MLERSFPAAILLLLIAIALPNRTPREAALLLAGGAAGEVALVRLALGQQPAIVDLVVSCAGLLLLLTAAVDVALHALRDRSV